ncbi:MAG: hypothetical protein UR85_C0002G0007 [Candidatus Nomurabacteria bacterium GW2011_GWF2_35_66]|uniref:Uncharacterized protein n=1 Tax=Candidatus Nomurabacteria bacterium GW2011_GWE1_35_16 TaxID=1618761 RepID=A0A0G0BAP7_9BACT|nr:MAG: hypothetical protein UR55_C0007G0035 [Candidatus Nomurabacteria bacterium GW2011_GWF1_34_20]KKP63310.1 MAG: hypothetical protein UR57_C0006G0035 [Candidatus Nomurabacteria bacterium GW2011_GWE2_34_25]KKP66508.1 MAG: hypothetical protein UR64_C0006G0035 [Candidatus Nomurabacteria bacterium GW2011_GWE1_35_16]KKP83694.1 MAG: hypothetical protein UR85_C0002G0007 [Candidatus Nomurabacteria bacterium GW2011_GWF2_35_66]HAE36944.1 hypothetical protein [Candidatus Nomurabacteria bacterium]
MKNNKTNFILAFSILLFIICSGIFIYLLNVIKNKNKHISAVTTTLEKKIIEKDNIKILETKMQELNDTHERIGNYLVSTSNIDIFVEYLEDMGIKNSVDLIVKGVDSPKNEKNIISVSLNITGKFTDVMKTIALLENSQYNIMINSFYLTREDSQVTETNNPTNTEEDQIIKIKSYWRASLSFRVLSL